MGCRDRVLLLYHSTTESCKTTSLAIYSEALLVLLSLQCYGLHASSWRGRELNTFQDPDTCSYNRNAKWLQPLLLGSLLNNRHHIKCYKSVADSENPGDFKTFSKVPPCFSSLLAQVEKPAAWQEWPQWQGELLLSDPVCCSWLMRVLDLFVVFLRVSTMIFPRCYQTGKFYTEHRCSCCIFSRKLIN